MVTYPYAYMTYIKYQAWAGHIVAAAHLQLVVIAFYATCTSV